jgi:hypothetical protein
MFAELLEVIKAHLPAHRRPAFYLDLLAVLKPHGITLDFLRPHDPALDDAHKHHEERPGL